MIPILAIQIRYEQDVVLARQRAKQISAILGCDAAHQARMATAVSEIARNVYQYAGGGRVEFLMESSSRPRLAAVISDSGPGIPHLSQILEGRYQSPTGMGVGMVGARRLMDGFHVDTTPTGTTVRLEQYLPRRPLPSPAALAAELAAKNPQTPFEELQQQNQEMLQLLEQITQQQREVQQLNSELEETNRGVVALYAELDDRADSLRRASELKSRFLSYVSHEFRTPVNSILSLSGFLLARLDGDLTSEQEKQVVLIRTSGQSLIEMVNDLLDLARVEAGKLDVQPAEFPLTSLFGTLRGMMRPLHVQPDVSLVFEEPDSKLVLYTDEGKLSQVARNFVSNALKFTESGEVRVGSERREGDRVAITVRDTGIGISKSDQSLIFQEFVQIPNAAQKRHKGTGLGLPLSRKLAELLGGTVEVDSTPGEGSTFTVIIPRRLPSKVEEPLGEIPASLRAEGSVPGPTVLLVDDDDTFRYVLKQHLTDPQLSDLHWRIIEARDGLQGRTLAIERRPELIILDLVMTRLTGFELLDELQRRSETRDIPVVICTSHVLSDVDLAALEQKAAAIISKASLATTRGESPLRPILSRLGFTAAKLGARGE